VADRSPDAQRGGRRPGAPVTTLTLPLAAFGTLSNGSDVRLLASPQGEELPSDVRSAIERFFYAAWKAVGTRSAPYYAFLPLSTEGSEGGELWGLSKVCRLGRGATGDVLVVWTAILSVEQLDCIAWATHRLLASAFPQEIYLPPPNTRLPPHTAALALEESKEVDAYNPAFDRLAFRLTPDPGRRVDDWRAVLTVRRPAAAGLTPLSAEGALFGLWNRLGRWRAGLSYCTWGGVEAFTGGRPEDRFTLLLADEASPVAAKPGVYALTVGDSATAPQLPPTPRWWEVNRDGSAGVAPLTEGAKTQADQPDAEAAGGDDETKLGEAVFKEYERQLVGGDGPSILNSVADLYLVKVVTQATKTLIASALLDMTGRTVRALGRNKAAAGRIVDAYVADILPRAAALRPQDEAAAARMLLDEGLLLHVSDETLGALSTQLFGGGAERPGLIAQMIVAVDGAAAGDGGVGPLLSATRPHARAGGEALELYLRLIVLGWRDADTREEAREALTSASTRPGFRAVLPVLERPAPAAVRRSLFVAVNNLRPKKLARRRGRLAEKHDLFRLLALGEAIGRAPREGMR
jgi:hypothetical protein